MAHCAFLLAIVLPFLVAAAHIIGTGQLPVSYSLRRHPTTSSSPRRQPLGTNAPSSSPSFEVRRQPLGINAPSSSSSFEVRRQPLGTNAPSSSSSFEPLDTGDMSSFFEDHHQPMEPKLEPEPAVLEELKKRGSEAVNMAERLEHLGQVLRLFGYNKMASAVPLLVDSKILSIWSAPVTVFAVPDVALQYACPNCPLRLLVLKQLALGSLTFSELSSRPSLKFTTPAIKFCMSSTTSIVLSSGGALTKVVSINSVDITRPELYNDGRFIIHGVKSYIHLPPEGSCFGDGRSLSVKEVMKILHDTFVGPVF